MAYAQRYKNLDSTYFYARKAYSMSGDYPSGKAEALNNIAFVSIAKMNYRAAKQQLDSVYDVTDNQIELLIADVQMMRLCQRQAQNKNFYDYREMAIRRLRRIDEELSSLEPHDERRLLYAETEYGIVSSTYYYYVGLNDQAIESLKSIDTEGLMQRDTAQYVDLLYQYGSGGIIKGKSHEETIQKEYELLLECYLMSRKLGYKYWEANAMQGISEHLSIPADRRFLLSRNAVSIGYLNVDNMPDTLLAGYLAQRAMEMFRAYGDVYQIAGSQRTLANCFWEIGDYNSALYCLQEALASKSIQQAPDLVASISEQLSIVYSSMNDKRSSDLNRNHYLDLQERTRQDMELDARAAKLENTSKAMNLMILSILVLIFLLCIIIYKLVKKRAEAISPRADFDECLEKLENNNLRIDSDLQDDIEQKKESLEIAKIDLENNKRLNIDNRAKVFLVDSVMPLVDRMMNEVEKLKSRKEEPAERKDRIDYISELSKTIDDYNRTLTDWIQLRQGDINLSITTFKLQELFDIVKRSKALFAMQEIELNVADTPLMVKADRVLTLFMINTIADNARKFTKAGGRVEIFAEGKDGFVEISVRDNGRGMTADELSNVFDRKVSNGHGFGLMNCRGILNKYRKFSSIFNVCKLSAESTVGKGSRFFFRLPKGGVLALLLMFMPFVANAQAKHPANSTMQHQRDDCLRQAASFADSSYYSNVNGDYAKTLAFADSTLACMNRHYRHIRSNGSEQATLSGDNPIDAADLKWFKSRLDTDFSILLDIRNESAVAALALHEWQVYRYNNYVYTTLFKEVYSDKSLSEYCRIMQRSETNKNIAIVLLAILLLALFISAYVLYYRRAIRHTSVKELLDRLYLIMDGKEETSVKLRKVVELKSLPFSPAIAKELACVESLLQKAVASQNNLVDERNSIAEDIRKVSYERDSLYVSNNIMENCLSTIKHETMYYPSRIYNFIVGSFSGTYSSDNEEWVANIEEMSALVGYYKELYSILCEQVHRQTQTQKFRIAPVEVTRNLGGSSLVTVGDSDLLAYLFLLIKKQNGGEQPQYTVETKNDKYLSVVTRIKNRYAESNGEVNLFVPSKENIPFLICRQIVREISSAANMCGCGITARKVDGGEIEVTVNLPSLSS